MSTPSGESGRAQGWTHLFGHDGVRRNVLHLFHAPAVALPKLVQVLEVLIAQIILDLRVQVEASKGVRQRGVIRHALRARRRGSAGRRRRGRGRDGDEAIDGGRWVAARRGGFRGQLGLEDHRRRTLFSAPRARLVCRCLANRYRVRLRWRLGTGDIELERLEVALRAKTAHGGSMHKKFVETKK